MTNNRFSHKYRIILFISVFAVGILAGVSFLFLQSRIITGYASVGSYPYYSINERIELSDAIFEGEVISITAAQFNQDSGDYWEASDDSQLVYPYHLIEIEVLRPMRDSIAIGTNVTITQVGNSPMGTVPGVGVSVVGESEHSLQVGDHGVFFVRQMDFPWREGGNRSVIHLVGWAEHAYFRRAGDGLYYGASDNQAFSINELERLIK